MKCLLEVYSVLTLWVCPCDTLGLMELSRNENIYTYPFSHWQNSYKTYFTSLGRRKKTNSPSEIETRQNFGYLMNRLGEEVDFFNYLRKNFHLIFHCFKNGLVIMGFHLIEINKIFEMTHFWWKIEFLENIPSKLCFSYSVVKSLSRTFKWSITYLLFLIQFWGHEPPSSYR